MYTLYSKCTRAFVLVHFTVNIMTDYIHSSDTCAKTRLYLTMKTCDYGSSHNNDKTAAAVARLWAGHRHLRTMA